MATRKKLNAVPALSEGESHSVEIRKIDNGYISRHSHVTKGGYKSCEVYSPTKPDIGNVPAPKKRAASSPARKKGSSVNGYRRRN